MRKPGDIFERYTIEAAIGQGGMGSVYRAHDSRLGRRVALKVISDASGGPEANARLVREARAAAALDHPNAVAIFDAGEHEGAPFIVMELVSGSTLREVIGAEDKPAPTRIRWLADAARALAAAHRRGLVHRDIKPENVMVRDDGVVKVLDFGIARRSGGAADPNASTEAPALPTLTVEGVKLGTPVYMAPEQIRGEVLDGRADQFAWGVLAYELLTGRLPWRGAGDALAVVASILTDEVDVAPLDQASIRPEVRDVVLRALAKDPEDRFASMEEIVRVLDAVANNEPVPAVRSAPPDRAVDRAAAIDPGDPGKGATAAQRYSTQEIRDVLTQAIERQASKRPSPKLGFDDLLAAAREVGVDEDVLREVSRDLRARGEEANVNSALAAQRDAWIRQTRLEFYRHAGVYVIVLAALLGVGLLLFSQYLVYLGAIALLWGIGLGIHGLVALTANEDDWSEEHQGRQWWEENRRRKHEVALARAGGKPAALPEETGAAPGPRVETTRAPPRVRVHVATNTERERLAEEEAAQEEPREGKRKRRR
jgi:serine/threonine-protein kinase